MASVEEGFASGIPVWKLALLEAGRGVLGLSGFGFSFEVCWGLNFVVCLRVLNVLLWLAILLSQECAQLYFRVRGIIGFKGTSGF